MTRRLVPTLAALAAGAGILVATTLGAAAAAAPSSARSSNKNCSFYVFLNQHRSLFRGNTALRKALNFAVDRTAFADGATPLTHLLGPGMAGSRTAHPYPVRPNLAKAHELANGHLRSGSVRVAYQNENSESRAGAQLLQQALIGLGFAQAQIEMDGFVGADLYTTALTQGAPYDLVLGMGMCPASRESAAVLRSFVDPTREWGQYATNSRPYRTKLTSISRHLQGRARQAALGKLDLEVMRTIAPAVPLFVSKSP
jgi:ABC-type oligopeptide transport system substrate-binding subunit